MQAAVLSMASLSPPAAGPHSGPQQRQQQLFVLREEDSSLTLASAAGEITVACPRVGQTLRVEAFLYFFL